ncbi:MAG: hypothetical protein Kow0063_37580 [Anaerolineae bacterium]
MPLRMEQDYERHGVLRISKKLSQRPWAGLSGPPGQPGKTVSKVEPSGWPSSYEKVGLLSIVGLDSGAFQNFDEF